MLGIRRCTRRVERAQATRLMATKTQLPINGKVLAWALDQGGYDIESFAKACYSAATPVTALQVQAWLDEESPPSRPELVRMAEVLRRPTAVFFRRRVPPPDPQPNLREARGAAGRALLPLERIDVRWALRLQEAASHIAGESSSQTQLPSPGSLAENSAASVRQALQRTVAEQSEWKGAHHAFHEWRAAIEELGVFVLQFELGPDGIRGFSAWDAGAPIIAVNNSADEKYEARVFSLFHELAHLVRRDVIACGRYSPENDADEYWCDRFAAATLLPEAAVRGFASTVRGQDDLALASKVARHFNASLSASAIRISDLELADSSVVSTVFALVASRARRKRTSRGGGTPRLEGRRRQLGNPLINTFLDARKRGRLNDLDLADLLRIDRSEVDELAATMRG